MSSGNYFSGGFAARSQRPVTSQLPELQPDPTSQILNRLPVISGKRSLAEFQAQHQQNQALSFYLRNVKPRNNNNNSSSILGYPVVCPNTEITPPFLNYNNLVPNQTQKMMMMNRLQQQITETTPGLLNYPNLAHNQDQKMMLMNRLQQQVTENTPNFHGYPNLAPNSRSNTGITPDFFNYPNLLPNKNEKTTNNAPGVLNYPNLVPNKNEKTTNNTPGVSNYTDLVPNQGDKMMNKLQELEKHLLDDEDEGEDDTSSVVTNSEWSDTFRHLIGPPQQQQQPHSLSLSPTSSCSSCCSSAPPSLSPKQTLLEAATALSENKPDLAREILTRLTQSACVNGTAEHRLVKYFSDALLERVRPTRGSGLGGEDHALSTQMLFEASPCFKLGFMAANLAILDATEGDVAASATRLHVIDFEIGRGGHYVHLIHALAVKNKQIPLKITAITEVDDDRLKRIGDGLKSLATKVGVTLFFSVSSLKRVTDLTLEKLGVEMGDKLAVNLSFTLFKLPDESVTTENPRDELLRRVKNLSPEVVTVVEQEMNTNTAPFLARVNETCGYYSALFESLDSILARDNPDRVRIEEGLGRKLGNSVACEGRERVERCEVFGKWRARMGMAGFRPRPMTRPVVESIVARLGNGTNGNHGFTVKEENGGILFGWMGRTLTVASAWH